MQEISKKILFYINKIENNTIQISEVIQHATNQTKSDIKFFSNLANYDTSQTLNTQTENLLPNVNNSSLAYDSSGAAKYIVVVVLLYGFGIIFFIGSQVRSTQKYSDEVDGVNAEKILKSMETEIFTKEVLEKLSNKEHREKAWKIYLADNKNVNIGDSAYDKSLLSPERHMTGEDVREIDREAVESIERKLKTLKGQYEDSTDEIENIKEILKTKFKSNNLTNNFKSFRLKRKTAHTSEKKKLGNKSMSTPILILQTDVDGLIKHKEARMKLKNVKSIESINKSTCSITSNE
ncbi:unnamed protein product, partial [Brachionus calyciflorus]